MNAVAQLEPGHVVAGRYRVERQIGAGGVGSVYLVRHVHTDEELALKVLQTHALKDAAAVERFRKEARAPARIASEHVTRVTDADTAADLDNAPFLVMELLRGRDLTQMVEESGPLAPPVVVELVRQAARALDKAHGLGIIHRDLKPDNLFLTQREDGSPCIKVLDFGIARIADASPGDVKTQAGLVFGTPGYMAPEQMTGEMELISPATDVWALGLVAFYLLAGQDFWQARTLTALYAKVLNDPIPLPSQAAPGPTRAALVGAFDAWFARCVTRDPAARFQTAGEAATALGGAFGIRSSSSRFSLPSAEAFAPTGLMAATPQPQAFAPTGLMPATTRPSTPPPFDAGQIGTAATHLSVPPPSGLPQGSKTGLLVVGAGGALSLALAVGLGMHFLGSHEETSADTASSAVPTGAFSLVPLVPLAPSGKAPSAVAPSDPATARGGDAVDAQGRTADAVDAALVVPVASSREVVRDIAPVRVVVSGRGTRDQQDRLNALQRLCDQGTVTAAECAAKRNAILRGP